jgi:hypothetical protein
MFFASFLCWRIPCSLRFSCVGGYHVRCTSLVLEDTMFFARLLCWRIPCSLHVIKFAAVAHNDKHVVAPKCVYVLVTEVHASNFFRKSKTGRWSKE